MKKAIKKEKKTEPGTFRIGADLKVYEKTNQSWKISQIQFNKAMDVISIFKANDALSLLIDKINPRFFKGQISKDGKIKGARINVLPNGKILDKAFSLFAEDLTLHDESSHGHWDVIYKNPGGTYSYCYSLDKKKDAVKNKYSKVKEFEKYYPLLSRRVSIALKDPKDFFAVPMYTLLKTYMRVGNEIYYKTHGHKGLTTLKKKDISIKGSNVNFNYLAKDGVPMNITEEFPEHYIKRLNDRLKMIKESSFVFTDPSTGHPLEDRHFKKAFKKYCGREFYPHIVRSFYATKEAEKFLKEHSIASKDEVKNLFLSIAEKLGHKRFAKKENAWKDNYNITIHYYIQPSLVEQIKSIEN